MGDFFAPPTGYPEVPADPPTPPPDFTNIGSGIYTGMAKAAGAGGLLSGLFDILVRWFTACLGFLLAQALKLIAWLMGILNNVESDAQAGYGAVIAATLKNLLGVNVDPSAVNVRTAGPGRQAAANAMGAAVINALFSGVQTNADGTVVPSDASANSFLATTMAMELNGWIESWFTDAVSYHLLEKYGDLKDGIARVMGLGRMSHQVFRPVIKTLVHDPYQQLLNQKYRPKVPAEQSIIRSFFRSELDSGQVSQMLALQGYTEQEIGWAIAEHYKYLPLADVDYLLQRGVWSDQDAIQYLAGQGYDSANAQHMVTMLDDKRTFKYRQEMVSVAEAAYVAGNIDVSTFNSIVSTLNFSQEEQTWIGNLATLKRSLKVTRLSLGQIETGIKDGILSFADLQTWALRENMPADDLANLELMIQYQTNKQTATAAAKAAAAKAKAEAAAAKTAAAQQKAAQAAALAPDKGVTVAQAETLVTDGLWTMQQLQNFLTAKGYGAAAISAIVELLQAKIAKTAAGTTAKSTVSTGLAAKGLSLATTEKAVIAGILTMQDLQQYLTAHGFDAADIQTVMDLTQQAVDAAKVKAAAKTAAATKAADKQLSLADLEKAVRLGLTTMDAYNAALKAAGFDAMSITLLDGILNQQIATDKAAAAKKAATSSATSSAGITISQLEQEVINGIRPIADYTNELAKLGYSATDQTELTDLLQLQVDAAQVTAAKRSAATAALSNRGISLAQAETAVKLGVVPIGTYTQMLQQQHFAPDAVQTLTNSLLAEVAKTSKAQTAANAAAATVATRAISLPQIEAAVIAGIEPIATYTNTLTAAGYSTEDADTLTQLLQMKLTHAQDVAATHVDATAQATQKGISLSNLEAAVVAGDRTMDDYDAVLTKLGYDAIDRATLEQLLQTKVAAAAAKAAKASGSAAGDTTTGTPTT